MRAVTNRCGDEHQIETTFLSTSTATAVGALMHLVQDYSGDGSTVEDSKYILEMDVPADYSGDVLCTT